MKRKNIINKILRKLRITKPIDLTPQEKDWIKLLKGHYYESKIW